MKEIIGIISTVLFFELIVILFKIELFDPYRKKKEQNNNPDFMAFYNLANTLNEMRNKKKEELKELQTSIDKFTNCSHYLAEIMRYDELIKKSYEEMDKIRKEKKLKYL